MSTVAIDPRIAARGYAHPESLVTTEWVAEHLNDPTIRIVESDEDVLLYELGHIPGAVKIDWHTDLQDPVVRDFIGPEQFAELCARLGITPETRVIFYGDKNNWWAAYAFWFFRYMGHGPLAIMDGGRKKWEAEGRPMTREVPSYPRTNYPVPTPHPELRAFREEVLAFIGYRDRRKVAEPQGALVDVRSPGEYRGELLHMPDYPQEGALRGGHIPGAANIPWAQAVNEDGTFKSPEELRKLYESQGVTPDKEVIVYCRIGERSSHTWFVLHELLGYPKVRNYDGSWTEWGNVVGVPIER
ncbi:MAG: sulfurtransferase [Thermomicrobium sp.]|nr:sulfurtransferase [Thermomicrobium sp.]